jgi:ABC-type multidrug transport system ATPase subunit
MAQHAIRASGLTKRYVRRPAVTDLGFAVEAGQVCALLGPNGAGKTTTMRMLAVAATASVAVLLRRDPAA